LSRPSAAFAQSAGEQTGVNSALGIAKTEDFIKEAATSDMLEIEAAKIAQQKGNADEKQFAQSAHTRMQFRSSRAMPRAATIRN
jgi:putative membrane protein